VSKVSQNGVRVMRRRVILLLVMMGTALLLASGVAVGQAQTITFKEERIPVESFSVTNPCNGETVELSGYLYVTAHATINANEVVISELSMIHYHLTGTGSVTNAPYTVNVGFRGAQGGDQAVYSRSSFQVIGKGEVPNFKLTSHGRFTINANGEITAQFNRFSTECTG
jgi:hypothetical protein